MKKMFLTTLLVFFGATLFAQERIAVFPFEDLDNILSRNEAIMFYREFSNEFTNKSAGKFTVVPRQDVERLINMEASFQLSDFSAREKTAEMNRVLNGTQILSGIIGIVGSRLSVSVSLYTYPELRQLPGGIDMRVSNIDELFDKIPELIQNMHKAISATIPPPPPPAPPPVTRRIYKIGDYGPGGGIVFSVSGSTCKECSGDLGRYSRDRAFQVARSYQGGGLNNWRLPNRSELDLMYTNLKIKNLGGFSNVGYWSASDAVNFGNGRIIELAFETNLYLVRAVRSFSQ